MGIREASVQGRRAPACTPANANLDSGRSETTTRLGFRQSRGQLRWRRRCLETVLKDDQGRIPWIELIARIDHDMDPRRDGTAASDREAWNELLRLIHS